MACELETDSLNQEECAIFGSDRRGADATPTEELMLEESSIELHPSLDVSSCSSTKVHPSDSECKSDIDDIDTVASHFGKVCSWNSLPSSFQIVFPDDTKYTYIIESYQEKELKTFLGAPQYAFEVQARVNVSSENDAKEWLSKLYAHSNCTYRFTRGANKAKGKRVMYKAFQHCQHQKRLLL